MSLLSLVGVAGFSFVHPAYHTHALQALLGLAFGTLIGGTFLDLLPEASEALHKFDTGVSAVCMCGILFGYLTERITNWVTSGTHNHHIDSGDGHASPNAHAEQQTSNVSTISVVPTATDIAARIPVDEMKDPHPMAPQHRSVCGLTPVAMLSLSGDAIHNFLDGLVIGAAFVASINSGMVTTVGVALHEIPQEIGDFGILLQSGLTVKQALLANLGVGCTGVAGAIITLAIGHQLGSNAKYALPFAGGVFLYLALSGVVPEMQRHINAEEHDELKRRNAAQPSGRLTCCRGSFVFSMTRLAGLGVAFGVSLMWVLTLLPGSPQQMN